MVGCRFLPICSHLGFKFTDLFAAMALQQLLCSSLTSEQLQQENLFEEEDPWACHRALLQGLLVKFPQVSKPELRKELGSLWNFHKQSEAPMNWQVQRGASLRRLLSKVLRTSRQCKTTERLTPSMAALVKVVSCASFTVKGKRRRLLKKTSSTGSPAKKSPAKKQVEVPKEDSASATGSGAQASRSRGGTEGLTRAGILALYKASPKVVINDSDTSDDSSVVVCSPAASTSQQQKQKQEKLPEGRTYFDAARGKVVHCLKSGQILEATSMQPGPMGLLLCTFEGFEPIQSEVPNLRLVIKKRPAAMQRKPESDEEGWKEEASEEEEAEEEE